MPWRNAHALHIFAPAGEQYDDNWVEQILGSAVKPLCERYEDGIRWLWVTRYSGPYIDDKPPVGCHLADKYILNGSYRFVVFRLSVTDEIRQSLHHRALQLAAHADCYTDPRGWIDYDVVSDLGSDRFVHTDVSGDERAQRAKLVAYFVDATVRLMLDQLTQDKDGKWALEAGTHKQNPNGSVFESVHHLFCNAAGVPTTVLVSRHGSQLQVGTFWMNPLSIVFDPDKDFDCQVRLQY